MIDYLTCNTEELIIHLRTVSRQAISQQITRYSEKNPDVARKIRNAQKIIKIRIIEEGLE